MIKFIFINKEAHYKNKQIKNNEINDCFSILNFKGKFFIFN